MPKTLAYVCTFTLATIAFVVVGPLVDQVAPLPVATAAAALAMVVTTIAVWTAFEAFTSRRAARHD